MTIPKSIREELRWEPGDRLDFTVDDRGRVILELAGGDIHELRGLLHRGDQEPVSVEAMNEAIGRHLAGGLEESEDGP